jgi:AcrR family transcriptional regulator
MTPEETTSKGERTRQAILDAAYDLFLTQGYSATSMRQVAGRSGLALGGIYNHFASKDEIFQALVIAKHPYLQIIPLVQNVPGETVEEFVRNAARIIQTEMGSRPDFMKLMLIEIVEFSGSHFPKLFETISPMIVPLLERFTTADSNLRELPLPLILRTFMGSIVAFYITEFLMSNPSLPAEMRNVSLEDFMNIYMHGILEHRSQKDEQ